MKRLGMIVGALIVLLGGGASWYFFLKPQTAAAASVGIPVPDPIYIDLAPLVLPIIAGDDVEQVVQITVTIEVADEAKAERIRIARPRLADAYVQDLYGAVERRRVMDGKVLDVSRLRDELTRSSIGVLGENSFSKILIQRIAQRSL